ncbi:MAG: glycosyltransferase family 4 protein [Rubrivivax sp.]|nr:glycosyltransferase family 4 protein [Rubrivivax sp.]
MTFGDLHICMVGPLPPPSGGMANQTRQLTELLRSEGATVSLVQVNAPYRPAWIGGVRGLRAVFRIPDYVRRLWRAVGPADVVHVMANSGWSWHLFAAVAVRVAAWRGTPVVVNYRGGEADAFLQRAGASVRRTMRLSSGLLLPSGFLQEVFARHGMPGKVVPNIVDTHRFRPGADKLLGPGTAQLLIARNLEPIYGIDVALRAFARVLAAQPRARLVIAGSGPQRSELVALAESLGIAERVHFAGRLERDEMAKLYRESTLSINPSHVDNMPNSVLESMASGVPVVSTDVGGVPFIVAHERSALLVPRANDEALAQAVLRLLGDDALYRQLRAAGLAEVQRYRWEAVRGLLLAAYGEAIQASGPRAQRAA